MRRIHTVTTLAALAAIAGCTSVQTEQAYTGPTLPKPDMIVVYDFAVSPDEVQLGSGLIADVQQSMSGTPRTEQEQKAGHMVADAFARHLVAEIQDLGLPAQRVAAGTTPAEGSVSVDGQFVSIDEGNRAERMVIGLGAGRSDVRVHVQVYDGAPGGTPLEQLEVDADSGRKPGAAEMLGVGAVAGHLAVSAAMAVGTDVADETLSATVEDDADRAAKGVAKHLAVFFTEQGWISES